MSVADTPMMQQYFEIRGNYPDYLLFYRMGDFYELFADDALLASNILGITLTKRRTSKQEDAGIPMCGVPFHASEGYIAKLLNAGHKVALCEQVETPEEARQKRGAKALVKRDVVRLYTSGTLTEDTMLNNAQNHFLMAVSMADKNAALAWCDLSTGDFSCTETSREHLADTIAGIQPCEILCLPIHQAFLKAIPQLKNIPFSTLEPQDFSPSGARTFLQNFFNLNATNSEIAQNPHLVGACGAVLRYLELTQINHLPILKQPRIEYGQSFVHIDTNTRNNLELTQTLRGQYKGSLLHTLDKTQTAAGKRMLTEWLNRPLQNIKRIHERQQAIQALISTPEVKEGIQTILAATKDISRCLSRISLDRSGPRDLQTLRDTLKTFPDCCRLLQKLEQNSLFYHALAALEGFVALTQTLTFSLKDDESLPLLVRDGNFVHSRACEKLNKYRLLTSNGLEQFRLFERQEAEKLGVSNLRVKYNKVWGYFIEISKQQVKNIPESYVHRQTTTSTQRFTTAELMALAQDYSTAEANALQREQEIFNDLVQEVKGQTKELLKAADYLALLDVLCAGATLAAEGNWCCPKVDDSTAFTIKQGRHPVVERTVNPFIANSTELSGGQLWLITGPNMAGKSTFLRQNALIALLAHIGFYVPAQQAHIGILDRIFTRVGTADDLSQGQSTFMAEMLETANILNQATSRSLVILDEVGRGTATYDGLSIAWAAIEHLLEHIKSPTLFATHYHELAQLEKEYATLHCHHVAVKEWEGDVIFLHQIKPGTSPGSYGIHVAKLAGLPQSVLQRAQDVLTMLERKNASTAVAAPLPLFQAGTAEKPKEKLSPTPVEKTLLTTDPNNLTPREALELVYTLQEMVKPKKQSAA